VGIYFFTDAYVERDLAPIYGVRAFPIDYPNPIDKHEGKGGYGIWFHGLNKRLKPKDTNGCIALDNRNIDDLAAYITLNDTPVIISERINMVAPEELEKEAKELERIVESWRAAWAGKKIDRYMSFYNSRFSSGGKNRWRWQEYKSRLAKKYRQIKVEIKNLRLLKNDGVVLAEFDQVYTTEKFASIGKKKLYLQQNSKEWKITKEVFTLAARKQPPPLRPQPFSPREVKNFLYVWKGAWEKEDLKTYISCYAPDFRSRGMDLKAWKKHRNRLNKKYRSVKIDLSDLRIVKVSNTSASVRFKQHYLADGYKDVGIKKIHLQKKGKRWQIKKEEWLPLGGKSRL
jgi:murein L,D-transpeptidase YafK